MKAREADIRAPVASTCTWLMENAIYRIWRRRERLETHQGLLFIKGHPGSGKSTLMKAVLNQVLSELSGSKSLVASYFFDARRSGLAQSPLGLYRSLVYQITKANSFLIRPIRYTERWNGLSEQPRQRDPWTEVELQTYLRTIYQDPLTPHTIIFVDALDECGEAYAREIAYFLRDLTFVANFAGVALDICLSSRASPSISLMRCPEIFMDHNNREDIEIYVNSRFSIAGVPDSDKWLKLKNDIVKRSSGVFLWVVLVIDTVLRKWDEGANIQYLQQVMDSLPEALESLYSTIFTKINQEERCLAVRVFQWAIFAVRPLRLHEWHHILAFIREPPPSSLAEWQESEVFTENDDQLERQIRKISRGLIEVKKSADASFPEDIETISTCARAGSLDFERGESRVIQVIHESVREFLQTSGLSILDPEIQLSPIGDSHLSIVSACLNYLEITELDELIKARAFPQSDDYLSESSLEIASARSSLFGKPNSGGYFPPDANDEDFDRTGALKVARWLDIDPLFIYPTPSEEQVNVPASRSHSAARSQLLDTHFALLIYATFNLFVHARLAEKDDLSDPRDIVERLMNGELWN